MIFVTVGAQMPFDRLLRVVDAWAGERQRNDVFAQIGRTSWRPTHMQWVHFLDPIDFRDRFFEAEAVVGHAGMGTILTALEMTKPLLVLPRRFDLRETRNDHQFDTGRAFADSGDIAFASDEATLKASLDQLDSIPTPRVAPSHASLGILAALRDFIADGQDQQDEVPLRLARSLGSEAELNHRKRAA